MYLLLAFGKDLPLSNSHFFCDYLVSSEVKVEVGCCIICHRSSGSLMHNDLFVFFSRR